MNRSQQDTLNEDWLRLISWDVTDATGQPVTTLDALAKVLDVDRVAAAQQLMDSPASAAAPEELRAEAEAELAPATPGQVSLLDEFLDADPAAPATDSPPSDTAADTDDDGDAETDDDEDGDGGKPAFLKGKAFVPFKKGEGGKKGPDTGSSTRKETIAAGAFVSGNFGRGKVEVVVTSGKVPGVDTDVEGSKDTPACRVRVYEESDGDWKATDKRVAVKASGLKTIPPLGAAKFGKKSGAAGLVLLVAELDPANDVDAAAVRTAYERGKSAWPGETKTVLSREDWALGRARAFVRKSLGEDLPGYVGDDDLLP